MWLPPKYPTHIFLKQEKPKPLPLMALAATTWLGHGRVVAGSHVWLPWQDLATRLLDMVVRQGCGLIWPHGHMVDDRTWLMAVRLGRWRLHLVGSGLDLVTHFKKNGFYVTGFGHCLLGLSSTGWVWLPLARTKYN